MILFPIIHPIDNRYNIPFLGDFVLFFWSYGEDRSTDNLGIFTRQIMLFNKSFLPSLTRFSLISLSLMSSLTIINGLPALGTEEDVPSHQTLLLAQTSDTNQLPDGTYLYGTSSEPEIIGQEYMVFQVEEGNVRGAFYMPRSEYNCFTGIFAGNELNMSVIDPYDGTEHPYSVSLEIASTSTVAGNGQWREIGLEGYHRLDNLSPVDQDILKTCS